MCFGRLPQVHCINKLFTLLILGCFHQWAILVGVRKVEGKWYWVIFYSGFAHNSHQEIYFIQFSLWILLTVPSPWTLSLLLVTNLNFHWPWVSTQFSKSCPQFFSEDNLWHDAQNQRNHVFGDLCNKVTGSRYSSMRASLVAKKVKNLPAMWETWVWSLGWEDPWRREWQPTAVFLAGESCVQRSLVGYSPWGRKESDTPE